MCFLVSILEVCDSAVECSASVLKMLNATGYSTQREEALLSTPSQLLNFSLELIAISKEDQLLLLYL
jgi:hypothetical protein